MTLSLVETPPEQKLRLAVAHATDVGGRSSNEDAVFLTELPPTGSGEGATEGGYLIAVADGMGGYQRGEVASEMAIEVVKEMFAADPGADTALLLKQAFRRANDRIYENGQGAYPPAMMGTTLVVAATRGKYATIASIGDSRAYLARANRLTQITKDHSLVADQVAQGALTESEARESPHRNILTHALGHRAKLDSKMPSVFELTLLPEDRLFICTDGFFDVVSNDDFLNALLTLEPDAAISKLILMAKERNTTDNVTAAVLTVLPNREPVALAKSKSDASATPMMIPVLVSLVAIVLIAVLLYLFVI